MNDSKICYVVDASVGSLYAHSESRKALYDSMNAQPLGV
jgi:hypothetical protein